MKKSSKRFPISTEAVNSLGFKVRTSGIDLTDFTKNPLLLWMHQRPKGERADEILPLGFWSDLKNENGQITGVPNFDEDDEFAMKIYKKVENGTIKMASAGLKPFKFSADKSWLEQSSLQEASLVDIGSNKESIAIALYNEDNELIKLADLKQTLNINKNADMKLIELSADAILPLLKLKEGSNAAEAQTAILNLVTLSETQKTKIATLESEKGDLQQKLNDAEAEGNKAKIVSLVDKAIEDRKITADQKDGMIKLAEADYDAAKGYLETLKAVPTVESQMNKDGKSNDALLKLSWEELDKSGKLITLKEENPEAFKEKFKEKFGREPKS